MFFSDDEKKQKKKKREIEFDFPYSNINFKSSFSKSGYERCLSGFSFANNYELQSIHFFPVEKKFIDFYLLELERSDKSGIEFKPSASSILKAIQSNAVSSFDLVLSVQIKFFFSC